MKMKQRHISYGSRKRKADGVWRSLPCMASLSFVVMLAAQGEAKPVNNGRPCAPPVVSYHMDVDVHPERHFLKIKATVQLTAQEARIAPVSFDLSGDFKITDVWQGEESLQFRQEANQTTVEGFHWGPESKPLVVEYEGVFTPPYKSDSMENVIVHANEIRVTKTSHWYPELPLYSLDEVVSKPMASSRLSVLVPEGFWVVSGDEQIAEPQSRHGHIRFEYASDTTGALSFCAARYERATIPWGDKTVEACYFPKQSGGKPEFGVKQIPQNKERVLETLETARNILQFYSNTFGPYPGDRFTLAQKGSYQSYAYGVHGYIVMNAISGFSERTLAHEIAHQWWGNLVCAAGESERILTESLAEYSAFLYMERSYGKQSRVTNSRESLLAQIIDSSPLRKASFNTPNYQGLVYKVAPHIFHMLRYIVGEEDFFSIIRSYVTACKNQYSGMDDFIAIAESVHGKPLDWFFEAWLDRTQGPQYVLDYKIEDLGEDRYAVRGEVVQEKTDYRMPLKIESSGAGAKEVRNLWVEGAETPFEFVLDFEPEDVRFAEEMPFWILAGFFNSREEHRQAPKRVAQLTLPQRIDWLRASISGERPYELGSETEFVLGPNETFRLACDGENDSGYREFLVFVDIDRGQFGEFRFNSEGIHKGSNNKPLPKRNGVLSKSGSMSGGPEGTRIIVRYRIKDEKFYIKFRTIIGDEELKLYWEDYWAKKNARAGNGGFATTEEERNRRYIRDRVSDTGRSDSS